VETPEQVCNVFRTQVDVVLSEGVAVLNADDALVAPMAEYCDGEVVFFSKQGASDIIGSHLQQGGRSVLVADGDIVLASGSERIQLIKLSQLAGLSINNVKQLDSVLAAVAAAWAMNVSLELIRAGMTTFVFKSSDI
jgi:cyanophycin synthetase